MAKSLPNIKGMLQEILGGLDSSDLGTKRMARAFVLCLFGMGVVVAVAIYTVVDRQIAYRKSHAAPKPSHIEESEEEQKKPVKPEDLIAQLGSFVVALKPIKDQDQAVQVGKKIMNLASLEVVFICDSPDTRDYVQGNLVQVKDQVTEALTTMERQQLMTVEGKRNLGAKIIHVVNRWLPSGKIKRVYFPKFIVD